MEFPAEFSRSKWGNHHFSFQNQPSNCGRFAAREPGRGLEIEPTPRSPSFSRPRSNRSHRKMPELPPASIAVATLHTGAAAAFAWKLWRNNAATGTASLDWPLSLPVPLPHALLASSVLILLSLAALGRPGERMPAATPARD